MLALVPPLARLSLDHGTPAVLVGAALVILGQALTHRYSLARERRKEVAAAVDRVAAALVSMDRRVAHFVAQVGTGTTPVEQLAAADLVTDAEVEFRQAVFSLEIRMPPEHLVTGFFRTAQHLYTGTYLEMQELMVGKDPHAVGLAMMLHTRAREASEAALRAGRDYFRYGPIRSAVRRRYFWVKEFRGRRWFPSGDALTVWNAMNESDEPFDREGWTSIAVVERATEDSLVDIDGAIEELTSRNWLVVDGQGRIQVTLHGVTQWERNAP